MSSSSSVDLNDIESSSPATATVFFDENYAKLDKNVFRIPRTSLARVGLAVLLCIASPTTITDPWVSERRRRDAVVTMSIYKEVIGRAITRIEALRIAGQILNRAEKERLFYAEIEAIRGMQWER